MQSLSKAFLITAGLVAAAGLAGQAFAQQPIDRSTAMHRMTVRLPDGSLEVIRYSGDQPPAVTFQGDPDPAFPFAAALEPFDSASPFAEMDRISAAMDRETAAMLNDARYLTQRSANAGNLMNIDLSKLPKGAQAYTMISTTSGKGTCTRTTEYYSSGTGKPQVRTSSSGSCGMAQHSPAEPAHVIGPRPSPGHQPANVIEASYHPNSKAIKTAGLF